MKTKLLTFLNSFNLYIFLLPVFFVLHGFSEYYNLIKIPKALELTATYFAGTVIILLISRMLLKTWTRAALFTLVVMSIYFFFGAFQDFIMAQLRGSFITRYSFLLPGIFIILIVTFFYLKKTKQSFEKLKLYLNALILLLMLFDSITIIIKVNRKTRLTIVKETELPACADCPKPDIYFIITDGYSGGNALKRFFNYDNVAFENNLRQKGFFIADSSFSNYNYTIYSVASILNMDMLNIPGHFNGRRDMPVAFDAARHNRIVRYFKKEDYDIFNYSIFDIKDHPLRFRSVLMDFEKNPLMAQTFLYRLERDLGYHLITTLKLRFLEKKEENRRVIDLENISLIDSLTRLESQTQRNNPKFVYSHLVMPHLPYFFDSTGKRIPNEMLRDPLYSDRKAYVSYLKYVNRELLSLVDEIYTNTKGKAIIMLVGDHGCRECFNDKPDKGTAELLNLNAVYFPDKNYSGFYKGISNVNLFRVMLNSQFKKQLPMAKDSLVILVKE